MGRSLWALRSLCPDAAARLRLFAVYLALFAGGVATQSSGRAYRLRLRLDGRDRDWWVADAGELSALWEVFIAEHYGDHLPAQASLILDVGANTGVAAIWLRGRYPQARIIAVEPNPATAARLRRNLRDEPGIEIVEAAVSDVDGSVSLTTSGSTSLSQMTTEDRGDAVTVTSLTLDSLLDRQVPGGEDVDLLKLDTEGGEWPILRGPLGRFAAVVVEIHEPTADRRSPEAVLAEVGEREGLRVVPGRWPEIRWLLRR